MPGRRDGMVLMKQERHFFFFFFQKVHTVEFDLESGKDDNQGLGDFSPPIKIN
jgi:hypothetical protein